MSKTRKQPGTKLRIACILNVVLVAAEVISCGRTLLQSGPSGRRC